MIQQLDDSNFMLYAAANYDNPHCYDTDEFYDDLKRFKYLTRLLFFKLEGYYELLKPFLVFMNHMPDLVIGIGINNKTIKDVDIDLDMGIIKALRKI
mgnify:CR=1 FL=1